MVGHLKGAAMMKSHDQLSTANNFHIIVRLQNESWLLLPFNIYSIIIFFLLLLSSFTELKTPLKF